MSAKYWTDTTRDDVSPYSQSKTFAEKAAWDFVKNYPQIELVTICPGLVVGPQLIQQKFASANVLKGAFTGNSVNRPIALIDVQDVAEAHLQSILKPEANGRRFLLISKHTYFCVINNWIYDRHHATNPQLKRNDDEIGKIKNLDNESTISVLGINFKDV